MVSLNVFIDSSFSAFLGHVCKVLGVADLYPVLGLTDWLDLHRPLPYCIAAFPL